MRNYTKFYIDGEWVDPVTPKTLDVINPANETVAGKISLDILGALSNEQVRTARGRMQQFRR